MSPRRSGDSPYRFEYRPDLDHLPGESRENEPRLHGTFGVDSRPGQGELYYGLPGSGIVRISPDLGRQTVIDPGVELRDINFHSTRLATFDGDVRLILAANNDESVFIVNLEGGLEHRIPRPTYEAYADAGAPYKPTDAQLYQDKIFIADGYGSNYILQAERDGSWQGIFGGKSEDPNAEARFGTAHGFSPIPDGSALAIADRPHARIALLTPDGKQRAAYPLPARSKPCGVDFIEEEGRHLAVVGSLDDPEDGRPAPIYILDGASYELLSTIRPKEDLGIEEADHIHNVVWHRINGQLSLVCQAWNPGRYFVLSRI